MKRCVALLAALPLLFPAAQAAAYEEQDFDWDPLLNHYKRVVIAGVNKMARERPDCEILDPKTVRKYGGTPDDPEFEVTCGEAGNQTVARFSKTDVTGDPASDIPLEDKQAKQ